MGSDSGQIASSDSNESNTGCVEDIFWTSAHPWLVVCQCAGAVDRYHW